MREIMYDHSSILIVSLLFLTLVGATEAGYRIGTRFVKETPAATRSQINTIQTSLLGVLALLLGFTFSLSLQRYDTRSEAVVNEANAIGTTILRADLLPGSARLETANLLREYVNLRVRAGAISLDEIDERNAVLAESGRVTDALWTVAGRSAAENPNPVTVGLFIQALNELIDAYGSRDAALDRHVPEPVLFLMFGAFILTVFLVGYSAGVAGQRASFASYVLMTLIVCLVFIIIDLDRPRRGIIEVSQQSILDLQATVNGGVVSN